MDKKANRRHGLDLATGAGASNQQATKEKKDYRLVLLVIFGLVISVGAILGFMILSGIGDGIGGKKEGFSKGLFDSGCIGVVDIRGEIISDDISPGLFSQGVAGSSTIASRIAQADSRDDVKAILLVVDSPGGSVVATREIYDALEASKKPKVAYFREVAASGGYYVGAATDYIVSEPAALTGSIGVRATFTDLSPLFEKIGVNTTIVKSGRFKDIGDSTRPMTDEEKKIIQSMVDEIFEDFKSAVLKHRAGKIDKGKFDMALDARILSGKQAYKIGLVDSLGNRNDALKKAAQLGGLENTDKPPVCQIEEGKGLVEEIFGGVAGGFARGVGSLVYAPALDPARGLGLKQKLGA